MNLSTIEIPRVGARARAAEYRREAKRTPDPVARRELEEIAHAYAIAAREELALIALTPTIAAAGTVTRTLVWRKGTPNERRTHYLLPRLAAVRADARFAYTRGVQEDGSIEIIDRLRPHHRYSRGRLALDSRTFELPDGFKAGQRITEWDSEAWSAMVPVVPPACRPARGSLADRLVLWEVQRWEWATVPPPPGDPALLRHVGGDIYVVEATWDLTDLEKAVLAGRRPAIA